MNVILQAFGRPGDIARAYDAAIECMRGVLDELTAELPNLRSAVTPPLHGKVAQRMNAAVQPFRHMEFLTPMAAVCGAVADEMLSVMVESGNLERGFVNNGGDIAFYLAPGQSFTMGMIDGLNRSRLPAAFGVEAAQKSRGIATSCWSGPGYSMGIADAVTVRAATAAVADAASTMIGNATDLPGHAGIIRAPASTLDPESDLEDRLVTTRVGVLSPAEKAAALAAGTAVAEQLWAAGLIDNAVLMVQDEISAVHLDAVSRALVMERAG